MSCYQTSIQQRNKLIAILLSYLDELSSAYDAKNVFLRKEKVLAFSFDLTFNKNQSKYEMKRPPRQTGVAGRIFEMWNTTLIIGKMQQDSTGSTTYVRKKQNKKGF